MTRARTVVRNTLWSSLDLIVDFLLPVVTSVLVARVMGPVKLGAYVYIMWISTMAATLGTLGMPMAALKHMTDYAGKRQPEVVVAVLRTSLLFQGLVAAIIVGVAQCWVWFSLPPEDRAYAAVAVLAVFPSALMGIATAANSAMEELRANAIPSMVGGLTQALVVIATLVMGWGLVGLAASHLASRLADTGLRFSLMKRRLPGYLLAIASPDGSVSRPPSLPPGLVGEMARFCAQQTVLLLLTLIVWNRSEVYFLKRFCEIRQVAFYSVAFGIGLLPARLAGPFTHAAKASLFAEQGRSTEGGRRFAQVYSRYTALVVLPAAVGLAVVSGNRAQSPLASLSGGPFMSNALLPLLEVGGGVISGVGAIIIMVSLISSTSSFPLLGIGAVIGGIVLFGVGRTLRAR